jgi:hypothetical protein
MQTNFMRLQVYRSHDTKFVEVRLFQLPVRFLSHKELEEQIGCAGRDIGVMSHLEWLTERASSLVNEMTTKPKLATLITHQTFLQKFLLEIGRGVQALGLSFSARYANLIWHMRDPL